MLKSARQLAKVLSLDRKTQIRNIGIKIAGKLVLG